MAYLLAAQGKKVLAVTNDVGFMTDIAKTNIDKVIDALAMDHLWLKSQKDKHASVIQKFMDCDTSGLTDVCGECSFLTLKTVLEIAMLTKTPDIITGFNKYTTGGPKCGEMKLIGNVTLFHPYYENYDWKKICSFLDERGYVTDPTLTNCKHIRDIIMLHTQRFGVNPYKEEFSRLLAENQVTLTELEHYERWCQ